MKQLFTCERSLNSPEHRSKSELLSQKLWLSLPIFILLFKKMFSNQNAGRLKVTRRNMFKTRFSVLAVG